MSTVEDSLREWTNAGVLDLAAAERIRHFEAGRDRPSGLRWQILLALIFGAILLASGIALFVAAHWDELSLVPRFTVVMLTLAVLHAIALLVRDRFPTLGTVMHGVGTLAAGA